jgi:hypothetical protein
MNLEIITKISNQRFVEIDPFDNKKDTSCKMMYLNLLRN